MVRVEVESGWSWSKGGGSLSKKGVVVGVKRGCLNSTLCTFGFLIQFCPAENDLLFIPNPSYSTPEFLWTFDSINIKGWCSKRYRLDLVRLG